MVQLMHWWPEPARGLIGYMRPIPAFGCVLVLILVSVDWCGFPPPRTFSPAHAHPYLPYRIQRTPFEALGQAALRHPDLADLGRYYARAPASGLWTLHLGERFVGLVGLDASADASFAAPESASRAEPATPPAAVLRHLYVEEQYRAARAQDDLLAHALRTAFGTPGGPASVRARTTGVQGYVEDALRRAGFVSDERAEGWAGTVGLLKWRKREWTLQKTEWESNR